MKLLDKQVQITPNHTSHFVVIQLNNGEIVVYKEWIDDENKTIDYLLTTRDECEIIDDDDLVGEIQNMLDRMN